MAAAAVSKRLLSASPPDWLLDLATLLRLFLQHVVYEIEYCPRMVRLLSLRNIARCSNGGTETRRRKPRLPLADSPAHPAYCGQR